MLIFFKSYLNCDISRSASANIVSVSLFDLLLFFVYSPPGDISARCSFFSELEDCLCTSHNNITNKILILGDLNVRIGNYDDLADVDLPHSPRRSLETCLSSPTNEIDTLVNFSRSNGLVIINGRGPDNQGRCTHFGPSGGSVIDYLLASTPALNSISSFSIADHLPTLSDHCVLSSSFSLSASNPSPSVALFQWFEGSAFSKILKNMLPTFPRSNCQTEEFTAFFYGLVNKATFSRKKLSKPSRKRPTADQIYLSEAEIGLLTENKNFIWKLLSNNRITAAAGPSLDTFFNHFRKLFSSDISKIPSQAPPPLMLGHACSHSPKYLDDLVTAEEILFACSGLKLDASPGSDGVTYSHLIENRDSLFPFLADWFSSILASGDYPQEWKQVKISPCFKKGDPLDPANYRPIALQSSVAKLFSKIIDLRMRTWLSDFAPLRNEQFGFQANTGTVDAVFVLHSGLAADIDIGISTLVAFIDFSNAFDSVNIFTLLEVLRVRGFPPSLLKLIRNMYSNCSAVVSTAGVSSSPFAISRGVKQGDPLSPLLFLLYIEKFLFDIDDIAVSRGARGLRVGEKIIRALLYADDLALIAYSKLDLECYLFTLDSFCKKFNLNVNTSKSKIMLFSKSKPSYYPVILFNEAPLEVVSDFKYLGIWLDPKLSYRKALKEAICKMQRSIGLISFFFKNSESLSIDVVSLLYSNAVLPHFTYGTEIWGALARQAIPDLHCRYLKRMLKLPNSTNHCLLAKDIPLNPPQNAMLATALNYLLVRSKSSPNILVSQALWYASQCPQSCRNLHFKVTALANKLSLSGYLVLELEPRAQSRIIKVKCFQENVIRPQRSRLFVHSDPPFMVESLRVSAALYFKFLGPSLGRVLLKVRTNCSFKPHQYRWGNNCPLCNQQWVANSWDILLHFACFCPSPQCGQRTSFAISTLCSFSGENLNDPSFLSGISNTLLYIDCLFQQTCPKIYSEPAKGSPVLP